MRALAGEDREPRHLVTPVGSFLFYGGRRGVRVTRLVVLVVVTLLEAINPPAAGLTGRHLLVTVTLAVAATAEFVRITADAHPEWVVPSVFVEAVAAGVLVGFSPGGATALLGFSTFDAAVLAPTVVGLAVGGVGIAATFVGVWASGSGGYALTLALIPGIAMLVGFNRRQFMLRAQETELRLADAVQMREEQARSARLAERASMAREIHDVLAHSLGALVLQLDAADAVLSAEHPDAARAARIVAEARTLAHEGLDEARRAVGTLRAESVAPLDESLRQLVDGPGAVGLGALTLQVVGSSRALRDDATLTAYRTAQEGVTNARKHAPGSAVAIKVAYEAEATVLTVHNDAGRSAVAELASRGGGHGLGGLAERAALLGGTLSAGPGPGGRGGWLIELRLPA